MNGQLRARYRTCRECPHRLSRHESQTGPEGFSSEFCGYGDKERELSQTFMEGPRSNCPIDRWADRIEVRNGMTYRIDLDGREEECGPQQDEATFRAWLQQRNRRRARQERKPHFKQAVRQVADSSDIPADAETALAVLVATGVVPGWLANEIANELGTTTT